MVEHNENTEEASPFIERVSSVLRQDVTLEREFEERLMSRVRAEAPRLYPRAPERAPWWRRSVVVRVSPIAGLALAAGIAGLVVVSALVAKTNSASPAIRQPAVAALATDQRIDTVHIVRFVLVDRAARKVELVGDFNEWTKGATTLAPSGAPGVWAVSVALPPGRHEYAFIINGSRWIADPLAPRSSDDFGTESSVIRVGNGNESAT